jgi:predicted MFS family arabinose efflux permease
MRLIERDEGIGLDKGADVPGAVLVTSALMLGVYTIVKPAAEDGWGATTTLLLGAVALALLGAFLLREATARTPLVPLKIFRSRNVSGANAIQVLLVAGMFGLFFLGSLYLEQVLGYDALQIGLAFLPATLVMGFMSLRVSEPLITRFGPRTVLLPGMVLVAAGLALFAQAPVDGNYWQHVFPVMIVLALGIGVSFPALMGLAMSGVAPQEAGLASGLINATAQVGGALGLAVLATVSSTRTENLRAAGDSAASALTGGYHLAFYIGAALVIGALLVAAIVLQAPRRAEMPAEAAEIEVA